MYVSTFYPRGGCAAYHSNHGWFLIAGSFYRRKFVCDGMGLNLGTGYENDRRYDDCSAEQNEMIDALVQYQPS